MSEKTKVRFLSSVVSRVFLSVIFICISILFVVAIVSSSSVGRGLVTYFQKQLITNKSQLNGEIDSTKKQLLSEVEYLAGASSQNWERFSVNPVLFDTLTVNMKNQFFSDGYCYFAEDGSELRSNFTYNVQISDSVKKSVLKGNKYTDLIKEGDDVYLICGAPVIDGHGKNIAAVFALQLISSEKFLNAITNLTTCEFTIFNGYTRYLTSLKDMKGSQISDKSIIDTAASGTDYIGRTKINGTEYTCLYTPLKNNNGDTLCVLFLGIELSVIKELSGSIVVSILPSAMFAALCLMVLVFFTTFKPFLINPLKNLSRAVGSLNTDEADLTIRIPISKRRQTEFDLISKDINAFIERLFDIVHQLLEAQNKLLGIVENLSTNSQESAGAIAQIMANIQGVKNQSENQASSVSNTSIVLSESEDEVQKLSDLINEETQGINNSSAAIEEMLASITSVSENVSKLASGFEQLSNKVSDGQQKLDRVSQSVLQIASQSESLHEANAIISQISSQTNLLAMNAAIESAHAGEAGKGFSVVADEIRKLAEDSAAQTKKIAEDLKVITGTINNVVNDSKESAESFVHIVENINSTNIIVTEISQAMNEQEEASKQVFESLSEMKNQSIEVNEKSKILEEGVRKVASEMDNVTKISDTILGSMDEMAMGAREINDSAQSVQALASTTQETTGDLDNLLNKFKVE